MPNINVNRRIVLGGNLVFSTEANALFAKWDSLGTPASTTRKIQVNNTINGLKSANIWSSLDCLYVWVAHSKLAACVDWKNPATRSATLNSDYAGSFVTDSHMVSNGTFWVDTNFNASLGVNFLRDSNSFGTYIKDHSNTTANVVDLSCTTSANVGCEVFISNGFQTFGSGNENTGRSISNLNVGGLKSVKRTASNAWSLQQDGQDYYSNLTKPSDCICTVVCPEIPRQLLHTTL